ncbi:MAG: hypothetical protein QNI92_10085 [Desulfobacterales bacterium]|nr:hypothetical protein [Desulfobacterales bacterium]
MGIVIHYFSKLFKIIIGIIIIFAFFIFSNVISMLTLSYLSKENYRNKDSPSPFFMVVLKISVEYMDYKPFVCVRWDDFKELQYKDEGIYTGNFYIWRNYEAYLSEKNGRCQNMSSEFEVENIGPGKQKVRLRWREEAFRVENHYSVENSKIVPLYYREFMSSDIVVFGFLISLVLTPILVSTFYFCIKRYKKSKMKPNSTLSVDS